AKARDLGGEGRAVAPSHQLEQPVVAQPILDVGALPALGEGGELGRLDFAEAVCHLPVVDPHRERVALGGGLRLEGGEAVAVALAKGFARVDDRGLATLGERGRRQCRGDDGECRERAQRERAQRTARTRSRARRLIYW